MVKNYYRILGISSGATEDEIRRSYRLLARACHPDRWSGDASASQIDRMFFRAILEAYQVLRDREARDLYDREYRLAFPSPRPERGEDRSSSRSLGRHLDLLA